MKVAFKPTENTPYTGIFRGAQHGILRVSETVRTFPEKPNTSPGFGIKFLRDGMDSADTVTMFSFDGQPSFNYFQNRWSTHLNEPVNECARETIGKKLAETTDHIGAMSVMNWSFWDEQGNPEKEPRWPFLLEFEPFDLYAGLIRGRQTSLTSSALSNQVLSCGRYSHILAPSTSFQAPVVSSSAVLC